MEKLPILFKYNDLMHRYPNKNSFYLFVYRNLKKGTIKQVKKGLYALVDPSTLDIYATKFQIASHLFPDSYFSYHEALEYYGLANQSFVSNFVYLSSGYHKNIEFNDINFVFKKSHIKSQIINHIDEEGVRVVSLERALIDSIDCISLSGGLEEIIYALKNITALNENAIIEVLHEYNESYLYRKVGYLFSTYLKYRLSSKFYKMCESHMNKTRYYLDKQGKTILSKRWNLIVPLNEKETLNELY